MAAEAEVSGAEIQKTALLRILIPTPQNKT